MQNQKVVIRFDEFSSRDKYGLRRIEGTVGVDSMVKLIDIASLAANPRDSKVGDITADIQETLRESPKLFHFKSKGVLLAAGKCKELERNRFELEFDNEDNHPIEGILDGGHNVLAIALFLLGQALGEDGKQILRGVKRWNQLPEVWRAHRSDVEAVKASVDFLTPVEILFPQETPEGHADFNDAILEIAQARNNNAQLPEETKANKAGHYDEIRNSIDPALVNEIEWRTNDGGRIKVRDLVALTWIPLSLLSDEFAIVKEFSATNIYNSKATCVDLFSKLVTQDGTVSRKTKGDIIELCHPGVKSAIGMLNKLPALYDLIYERFPEAYNTASPGFGRILSVSKFEPSKGANGNQKVRRQPPRTKFYRRECMYEYPDGFIVPLMWALRSIMEVVNGRVQWKVDPEQFINKHLNQVMAIYYSLIQMSGYDPQKVGKASGSYQLLCDTFSNRLAEGALR